MSGVHSGVELHASAAGVDGIRPVSKGKNKQRSHPLRHRICCGGDKRRDAMSDNSQESRVLRWTSALTTRLPTSEILGRAEVPTQRSPGPLAPPPLADGTRS